MHALLLDFLGFVGLMHLSAAIAGSLSRDPTKFTMHGALAACAIVLFIWSA